MSPRIPVFRPRLGEQELLNIQSALSTADISGTSGHFIQQFEQEFARYCGVPHAVALSSGSTALHLACVLADIQPGDEVLVSALTNIATANAVVQCGGIVVPIDSEIDTWNMDTRVLRAEVTPLSRAVIPVHLYGHPVDMDPVREIATYHGLTIIEDAAEAHGAEYKGRRTGSLGHMACFSFYANKIVTTGEGGMLIAHPAELADHARLLRNLAFTTPRFLHHEVGFNYRMTNLQAAIGCGQMAHIEDLVESRRVLASRYHERLKDIPGLRLPIERPWAKNVYWMYALVVERDYGLTRDELMHTLDVDGIETRTMFCPLNLQPALLQRRAVKPLPCPIAESLWRNGLYLPSDPGLTDSDLDHICDVIRGGPHA